MILDLNPSYDTRASFYNKAKVKIENNIKTLISYTTEVARIKNDEVEVYGTYSPTTLRHIKEFLKQNNFKADSKKQIETDYIKKVQE